LQAYAADYLQTRLDFSLIASGRLISLLSLIAIFCSPLLGCVFERWGCLAPCLLVAAFLSSGSTIVIGFDRQIGMFQRSFHMPLLILSIVVFALAVCIVASTIYPMISVVVPDDQFAQVRVCVDLANVPFCMTINGIADVCDIFWKY
jgi:nitrate/nitrite transporter NarK